MTQHEVKEEGTVSEVVPSSVEDSDGGERFIDLFAGLGGFRIGLTRAGFECVYGSDFNKNAAAVYKANFGEDIHSDITQVDVDSIPDFNILAGGFPCQPFSAAGKKQGFGDTRGTLFFDICRIVKAKKPRVVFLENVKSLTTHDKGNTFTVIRESLEELGYSVSYAVLNAVDYGVPQSRERIVIVASREGEFDFSKVSTTPRRPLREFLDPEAPDDSVWLSEDDYVLLEPHQRKVQKTGLIFAGYRKGNLRLSGVKENSSHLSRAHKQMNRIYDAEGSHPTLSSTESSGRYFILTDKPNGSKGVRKLSMDECYRIFGYPEDYVRVGRVSEQYNRIGNSIAVPMVEAVSHQIREQLFPPEEP